MSLIVTVKLTIAGIDTGPYDIFAYSTTPSLTPDFTGITKEQLLNGYTCEIPDGSTKLRVQSNGTCTNYLDLNVNC